MSENKHTPGPFFVRQPEVWPFDIEVVDSNGDVVWTERRYAHASRQRTVADCMQAVGFDHDDRPRIIELLERQLADMRLRAAAPDLLEALQDARYALYGDGPGNPKIDAAISKATGSEE